jgi:preprotein translocase subunit YajC
MDFAFYLVAQATESSPFGVWGGLIPMVFIFAIFYFLLVWPVRKRQKALQKVIENLKRGDRVVTNGGIYGEVAAVEGSTILLKVADNLKIKVAKSAISGLEGEAEPGRTS